MTRALLTAMFLLFAASASAQTRVVVSTFEGESGAAMRVDAVVALSREGAIELVEANRLRSAQTDLGVEAESEAQFSALARAAGADAIVEGRVTQERRLTRIEVRLRSGSTGEIIGEASYTGRTPRAARAALRAGLFTDLHAAIEAAREEREPEDIADYEDVRVVLAPFTGDDADALRSRVAGLVGDDYEIVSDEEVEAARDRVRESGPRLEPELERMAVAREVHAEATIVGRTTTLDGSHGLELAVESTGEAETVQRTRFYGRSRGALHAVVDAELMTRLRPTLGAVVARAVEPDPRSTTRELVERPASLDFSIGGRVVSRSFSYTDDLFGRLHGYRAPAIPTIAAELQWYPFALGNDGVLASAIGVTLRGELGVPFDSVDASGTRSRTLAYGYVAGLRPRLPIGPHEIAAVVGFGEQRFELRSQDDGSQAVPDTGYRFLALGLEARFDLGRVSLTTRAAYHAMIGLAGLTDFFPHATGAGLTGEIGAGYAVTRALEVRLSGAYRRYFFDMNSEPGDEQVAGGALDQSFVGTATIALRL